VLAIVIIHAFFFWSVRDRIARGDPDFTVFYTAARILREGRAADLYNPHTQEAVQREFVANSDIRRGPLPFIHPPFEAVVFVPFTYFSYPVAFALWSAVNVALLFAIGTILRGQVGFLRSFAPWQFVLASFAFFPVFANFHQGQDAILLLLLLVLAYRSLTREADFLAGCWLGFGLFKYHLILPLVLILVLWRGKRLFSGFLAMSAVLAMLSLAIVGWHGALQYPGFAWHVVSTPAFGGIPPRQLPNIFGLLAGWPLLKTVGWPILAVTLACGLLLLASLAFLRSATNERTFNLALSGAVIAALLVAYSTNTYDLSLLLLPLALVTDHCLDTSVLGGRAKLSLLVPALPLLVSPLWFFLWMGWQRINLIALFLLWWILAIRRELATQRAPQNTPPAASVLA
jgi:hypothetical protein